MRARCLSGNAPLPTQRKNTEAASRRLLYLARGGWLDLAHMAPFSRRIARPISDLPGPRLDRFARRRPESEQLECGQRQGEAGEQPKLLTAAACHRPAFASAAWVLSGSPWTAISPSRNAIDDCPYPKSECRSAWPSFTSTHS